MDAAGADIHRRMTIAMPRASHASLAGSRFVSIGSSLSTVSIPRESPDGIFRASARPRYGNGKGLARLSSILMNPHRESYKQLISKGLIKLAELCTIHPAKLLTNVIH